MKTRLGARAGKKTLEEESKWHPNTKECSVSKGQFGTFGVPNNTLKGPNFHVLGFGQWPSSDDKAHPFQSFRKRMHLDSHPNRPCLFFRVLQPL